MKNQTCQLFTKFSLDLGNGQITHLICVRPEMLLYEFSGGCGFPVLSSPSPFLYSSNCICFGHSLFNLQSECPKHQKHHMTPKLAGPQLDA